VCLSVTHQTGLKKSGRVTVKLWDVESWQDMLALERVGSQFGLTAFSPDGNAIGTMSDNGILNLWCAPSWAKIQCAGGKGKGGDQAAKNPDREALLFARAHAAGVKSLIWVILEAGKRVNKSLR